MVFNNYIAYLRYLFEVAICLRRISKSIAANYCSGMYGYIFSDDCIMIYFYTGMYNTVYVNTYIIANKTAGKIFTLLPTMAFSPIKTKAPR